MTTETVTLWYIRNSEDPTFHSVPFKSEQEATAAIMETELFETDTHTAYSITTTVTFDPKAVDRAAREWVAECYENYSVSHWSQQDCWSFIEAEHFGGRGAFILMASRGVKPFSM
jgi:hypothetical protein